MPAMQQGILVAHQTKTNAAAAGEIRVATVGGQGYAVNARQCRLVHAAGPGARPHVVACGQEVFGIGARQTKTLPSGSLVAAGKTADLELHNSRWTLVRVQVTGSWKAN